MEISHFNDHRHNNSSVKKFLIYKKHGLDITLENKENKNVINIF